MNYLRRIVIGFALALAVLGTLGPGASAQPQDESAAAMDAPAGSGDGGSGGAELSLSRLEGDAGHGQTGHHAGHHRPDDLQPPVVDQDHPAAVGSNRGPAITDIELPDLRG